MKAYIQTNAAGFPFNETVFNAYYGFEQLGIETVFFNKRDELLVSEKEDVVVGGLGPTKWRLEMLGCEYPELDYPEELKAYLGRNIWTSKINTVNSHPEMWPVFVKPYIDKRFTGRVISTTKDLIGCGSCYENYDVICSDVLDIEAEWRAFVRYGRILDVRQYKGDWRLHYDSTVIDNALKDYKEQPAGFAMDFGLTAEGKTVLIEVNDGFSIGSYGLLFIDYAKLLAARWAELTETEDELDFEGEKNNSSVMKYVVE
ncbi:MAG: ATP-grasp domain-containing protein [Lachnospiraceae bacterium]|nr:ATP-grasp domain-containing protein [Lachnospiraceae bacterium]